MSNLVSRAVKSVTLISLFSCQHVKREHIIAAA